MSAFAEQPQDIQELLGRVRVRRSRGRLRRVIYWWPVVVLLIVVVVAAFPGLIAPHAPNAANLGARLKGPGYTSGHVHYLLGTDDLGRDMLSRVIWGARAPVEVALAAVLIAGIAGTAIGVIAASFPRVLGTILMRIADMVLSIPFLLIAILIATVLGPSLFNVILVLALSRWPRYTRVAYAQTREAFQQEFVRSAHARAVAARAAGDHAAADRRRDARGRPDGHHRGVAVVPRAGRAAAHGRLGRDAIRGAAVHLDGLVDLDLSRHRDLHPRAGDQPLRGSRARPSRSA
jgi:hypothetical protein